MSPRKKSVSASTRSTSAAKVRTSKPRSRKYSHGGINLIKKLALRDLPSKALQKIEDKGWLEASDTVPPLGSNGTEPSKDTAFEMASSSVGNLGVQALMLDINDFFGDYIWVSPPILSDAGLELTERLWRSFRRFEDSEDIEEQDEELILLSAWMWTSYWVSVFPSKHELLENGEHTSIGYTPQTYWPTDDVTVLPAYIKGSVRKRIVEQALRANRLEVLEEPLLIAESLEDDLRSLWGRVHPINFGGEFLPDLRDGEVEIARIQWPSATADVASIRARRHRSGVSYRIVDEYELDEVLYESSSDEPLDVATLCDLVVEGTDYLDGTIESLQDKPEDVCFSLSMTSSFYPQLSRYFWWRLENIVSEGEEAGEPDEDEAEDE